MIITIAGAPGSGKTSVAKELAKRLGMKFYSMGDILEKMANEKGVTIDQLLTSGDQADHEIDAYQKKLGETEDNIIIEGKISWFFIPQSFKIFVTVDEDEGARRIFNDRKVVGHRSDEPAYASIEETKNTNAARVQSFVGRYKRLYGVENYFKPSHYDFVLDTTASPGPEQNADHIIAALKERSLLKK